MVASTWTMLYQFDWLTMHNKNCLCEESFDFTQNKLRDEAIRFRFLTAFGMTLRARCFAEFTLSLTKCSQ